LNLEILREIVFIFVSNLKQVMSLSKLSLESESISATKNDDEDATNTKTKEIRVFMDGAFDMMHFGHMNAFRLGRSLGTHLLVGINSDESIAECKGGLPLLNDDERQTMVESCKFVDEVVPNCPYIMNESYLNYILQEYRVDYVIHGDDPCLVDGKDVYATAKQAGKFKSIPRTEGISTTDLVGRVLKLQTSNLTSNSSPLGYTSRFLTTASLLAAFRSNNPSPKPGMKIVYVDGDFDMFHCGHVALLQAAKQVRITVKDILLF
jgi:ethanolamine-phosphate cytidylyltransferase